MLREGVADLLRDGLDNTFEQARFHETSLEFPIGNYDSQLSKLVPDFSKEFNRDAIPSW